MSSKTLNLNTLKLSIDTISSTQCDFYGEACAVALEHQNKCSGVKMKVTGDIPSDFNLQWNPPLNKNGWREAKTFTEFGALALSFFLSKELTEYEIIEEAIIATGIDYWLGYNKKHPNYDPDNFMVARLEISGILTETVSNSFTKRITEKQKQTEPTDGTLLPAYISIIEFSSPKAYFAKK